MVQRHNKQLPQMQQLLKLENRGTNVCYSNAGTNVLMSSPHVTTFLANLPHTGGLVNTVQRLACLQPKVLTNLSELRTTVAAQAGIETNFDNENVQQDACEWIMALYQTIASMLNGELKDNFISMFKITTTVIYECSHLQHHSEKSEEYNYLPLPVVDSETDDTIDNLNEIINKYFDEELIEKACHICSSDSAKKTEHITGFPQVLILQYKRYNATGNKEGHDINATTSLQLANVQYELTGFVMHHGEDINSGHYEAVTRCWETGKGYILRDNCDPLPIEDEDVDSYLQQAYILVYCKKATEEVVAAVGAPTEARRVGDQVTSQEAVLDEEEEDILRKLEERNYIRDIPVKNRTSNQNKQYRKLQSHLKKQNDKVNKVLDRFPHLQKEGTNDSC